MQLYQAIAQAIEARKNCLKTDNDVWLARWQHALDRMADELPSGSGFDDGTQIDLEKSNDQRLVLYTRFHHMTEGVYDGWTDHTVYVKPSLQFGHLLSVTGIDRNGIKDYISDVFGAALENEVMAPEFWARGQEATE
jgi:hypothetical protein